MFGLKENLDFLGKMLMIVQGKFMRLVGFVCVCLFHKKNFGFGWNENVVMKILGIDFLDVNLTVFSLKESFWKRC